MNRLTDRNKEMPTPIDEHSQYYARCVCRLAEYEDTGLTPEEVATMKAEYSDTFQAHLNELLKIKDKQIAVLQALCEDMENTAKEYRAFKEFFDALYGHNLTVENWHLNGVLEPFDNFYDKAVDEMRKERKNADTV